MLALQLLGALSGALLASSSPLVGRSCSTSKAVMDLPANQTALVTPTTDPLFVALGVGVQNYTCSSATSTYASIGAVASLFDISCLESTRVFGSIQTLAGVGTPFLLGFHYFVTSPSGTGISPKWDFTSTGNFVGNANAFVLGAKVGDVLAPKNSATNVDWLALNNVQGSLASKIFRIDTVGGQPPTSCVPGSAPISVKYTAKYFLY
ncbi:hypothetical protein B0H19DRAFT_1261982 [Mycena capillaripes]|nr:hypothetical protein B0H19DRAFT_1261982 [Mycena capillaripes]